MHSPLYIWWGEFGQQCRLYVRVASTQLYYAIKYLNQRLRYQQVLVELPQFAVEQVQLRNRTL